MKLSPTAFGLLQKTVLASLAKAVRQTSKSKGKKPERDHLGLLQEDWDVVYEWVNHGNGGTEASVGYLRAVADPKIRWSAADLDVAYEGVRNKGLGSASGGWTLPAFTPIRLIRGSKSGFDVSDSTYLGSRILILVHPKTGAPAHNSGVSGAIVPADEWELPTADEVKAALAAAKDGFNDAFRTHQYFGPIRDQLLIA